MENRNPTETTALLPRPASSGSVKSDDEMFAESHGMEDPKKTIGPFASFALITNNTSGPGMMSLPLLFQKAGIVPVVGCIVLMCICSSINGTMLSEVIASIPGNSDFSEGIEYSSAFDIVIGASAYYIAESLFLSACMVQALTGLVETAQSLDSFLASYLIGHTYALQLSPTIKFVDWAPDHCKHPDGLCDPFHDAGSLIISLGFVIVTLLFFPLGRGHLQETMIIQFLSFGCLVFFMSEFSFEFLLKGLHHPLPWFGNHYDELIGVILFNYAFVITVPSWLIEKTPGTNVNKTIWGASIFCSAMYITFGLLAAMAYKKDSEDMLTLLAGDGVSILTRICAAFFGVAIIGAGVPVFCVIIKNTLYSTKACSAHTSFFWGAVFPYLAAWTLYQGDALMKVLNWAGLVINGSVAFILPLILCSFFYYRRSHHNEIAPKEVELSHTRLPHSHPVEELESQSEKNRPSRPIENSIPDFLLPYRWWIIHSIILLFVTMILSTIILDIVTGNGPH